MRNTRGIRCGASAFLVVTICLGSALLPRAAVAGTAWPLEHVADVTCAFGAVYAAPDGKSSTHRGVDLAADTGEDVLVPVAGEVRFVGRVPASSGGTQLAVTIAGAGGVSFTFMPLEDACVSAGEGVSTGQRIAALAAEGDASSSGTHLHVGARRGDLYVDPMTFLAPPAAGASAPTAEPVPAPASDAAENPSTVAQDPQPATAVAVEPAPAESPGMAAISEPPAVTAPCGAPAGNAAPAASADAAARRAVSASGVSGSATARPMTPFGSQSDLAAAFGVPAPASPAGSPAASHPVSAFQAAPGGAGVSNSSLGWLPPPTVSIWQSAGAPSSAAGTPGLRMPSAATIASAVRRLGRAWLIALLSALAAAGLLWPLWRRQTHSQEDEPRCCIAPEGTHVAAAAGR